EIPMLSVHGQAVAGATFPVPMWHAYMSAAEWRRPARQFLEPTHEIAYRDFERHYFGYTSSTYSSSSSSSDTSTTTTTETPTPAPAPAAKPSEPSPSAERNPIGTPPVQT